MSKHGCYQFFISLCLIVFSPVSLSANNAALADKNLVYFMTTADMHFDPFISCQKKSDCPLIDKLEKAPASAWEEILRINDYTTSEFNQDTNFALLSSTLAEMKKLTQLMPIQFVLILGDSIGHNFRLNYLKFSKRKSFTNYLAFLHKTFAFLTFEFNQTFPYINVYSIVGNNDSYQGDYFTQPSGIFFRDIAINWSQLIKNRFNQISMRKQFRHVGYYSLDLQPDLKLIVLNTNLFSINAKKENNTAADFELNWLEDELNLAKKHKQKVLLAMHIPETIDIYLLSHFRLFTFMKLWKEPFMRRFQRELNIYAAQIAGIFAGHLHSDWFQILDLNKASIPTSGTPAVSPIFGTKPGFKIYSYSRDSQQLKDFVTYFYSLQKTNKYKKHYNFSNFYQLNCHKCARDATDIVQQFDRVSNYVKSLVNNTLEVPVKPEWHAYYWCSLSLINIDLSKKCID